MERERFEEKQVPLKETLGGTYRKVEFTRLFPTPLEHCSWPVPLAASVKSLTYSKLIVRPSAAARFHAQSGAPTPAAAVNQRRHILHPSCHLLFDQLQRHATTVQTAVFVKANPCSFQSFVEWQAGFPAAAARRRPASGAARFPRADQVNPQRRGRGGPQNTLHHLSSQRRHAQTGAHLSTFWVSRPSPALEFASRPAAWAAGHATRGFRLR